MRAQIDELTTLNESVLPEPWATSDAPADYVDGLQRAIVGVELVVDRLEGKRKLSQNRSDDDRAGAAAGMAASGLRGSDAAASAMRRP